MLVYLKGGYHIFHSNWKLLWANYRCQGKTYQTVNKCYTVSVSFLPSGKTQLPSDRFMLFTTLLFLAIWKMDMWKWTSTTGSALRGREGLLGVVVLMSWALPPWWRSHELFSRGLCLSAWTKKRTYADRWWGCELPSPLLTDEVPAAGTMDASTLPLGNFIFVTGLNIWNNYSDYLFSYLCSSTWKANWRVFAAPQSGSTNMSTSSTPIPVCSPLFKIPLTYSFHCELTSWWELTSIETELSELGLNGWAMYIQFKGNVLLSCLLMGPDSSKHLAYA